MKILSVLPEFPPGFGGMQTHAVELTRLLHERGHQIRVLTYQELSPNSTTQCDSTLPFQVERCLSRIGFQSNLQKVETEIERYQPDVIYSSTIFYGATGKKAGTPVICRSPGNDILRPWIAWPFKFGSHWVSTPWFEKQLYRFFKRLDYPKFLERIYYQERRKVSRLGALGADTILANSEYTYSHLMEFGVPAERIELMTGGVNSETFRQVDRVDARKRLCENLAINDESHIVMTSCRLVHKKGVDFLIRSIPALTERIGLTHLVILGDGPKRKKYQRIINQLGLQDQVSITGSVPQLDTPNWLAAADLFVLASRLVVDEKTGNCDAETMGRVICEANAAGIPTIAANSGGIPSVLADEQNGLLFQSDDEEDFISCVERLKSNPDLTTRLINSGRHRSTTEFDWQVLADQHEMIFSNLVKTTEPNRKELDFV